MIDYEGIIQNLKTEEVINLMQRLGADRYEQKEGIVIFPTICHNQSAADASMKLYFYENSKMFVCYTSCGNMSIFKFLKHYYEERNIEYNWYEDIYNVILGCSTPPTDAFEQQVKWEKKADKFKKRGQVELPEFSSGVLDTFVKHYPIEWLNDGISKDTMDKFNILYSISQNKIIIPHYDVNNRLVGIRGRALDDWEVANVGKYMPVKVENTWYNHKLSFNLYGLNETKENIKKYGICYLFESEKSVLQVESFSMPNCAAAVCGSNFNKYALNILMRECHPKEIVICFDKEEEPGQDKYFNKLMDLGRKYSAYCNFSFIYDWENRLSMKDSPSDKGEGVFKKLLDKRVKVICR